MKKTDLFIVIAFISLSGCSAFSDPSVNQTNISGAGSLFKESNFGFLNPSGQYSTIKYCDLLVGYGLAASSGDICQVDVNMVQGIDDNLRNEVQDYIIAASNQKCGEYFRLLHSLRGDTDVMWGGLATILAGAGAVISHGATAQAFSAAGAASSGIRAEFNQAYFANLALDVMTSGIISRRQSVTEKIAKKRAEAQTINYSLSGAISDALEYHNACTAVTGFEVAAEAITRSDNPGPTELKKFLENMKKAKASVTLE